MPLEDTTPEVESSAAERFGLTGELFLQLPDQSCSLLLLLRLLHPLPLELKHAQSRNA